MESPSAGPVPANIGLRLSIMMFLQFFVWGAWYVTLGPFMTAKGMSPESVGNAYSVGPLAAILSPVFLGMFADRFFATQRVLGVMHLLGGLALLAAPSLVPAAGGSPWPFVGILLAHMLCYMPTLGLGNTLAFHNMTNPEKQFPMVRVLGTIGWIVAGFVVGYMAKQMSPGADETTRASMPHFFYAAGISSLVLGVFSFTLPHTPPQAKGKSASVGELLGFGAVSLMRERSFAVFVVCSFLICIPLSAYYSFAGMYAGATGLENVPVKMSFGQMSEIAFMLVMPLCFARLGVKWMLAVGMLAWVARYALFAAGWGGIGGSHVTWMVLGGIILHGICYDFFFVTGQIYVDKKAPVAIRGQAQGFLVLVTQGLGMLIGAQIVGRLVAHYTTGTGPAASIDWKSVWIAPAAMALAVLVVFVVLFKEKGRPARE